jgi:hypothetical protein
VLVVGRKQFAAHFRWFVAAVALTAGSVGWYLGEFAAGGSLPGGGSRVGLALGTGAALIIVFEMLLWPRKRFPGVRTLPWVRTQWWMKAHIWLGLLCGPVALLHSGFRLGGWLTTALAVVLVLVLVSGVWGLVLQHLLPRRMFELAPDEVPVAEIERVMTVHTDDFADRLAADRGAFGGEPVPGSEILAEAFEKVARGYLTGRARPPALRVQDRAARWFADLTATTHPASHARVRELEELCGLRRQLDAQARLHWWLHNWVWVHLPLSVALVGLLVAHVYTALRYI